MDFYRLIDKYKWFLRLLIPYVLFIFLALLLGWLIYERTLVLVDKEAKVNNLHLLQQVKTTLDGRLSEIDTIVMQAANDPKIVRLQQLNNPFEGTNTYKIWATQKDLYNFSISNNFILNYLIFYRNSNIVIAPTLLYESEKFYRNVLNYNDLNYEQWHELFFEKNNRKGYFPASEATYLGKPHSIVTYRHPLGNLPGQALGSIIVLIDNNQILKLLGGLDIKDGGWTYIADEQGNVITSTGEYVQLAPGTLKGNEGYIEESRLTNGKVITYSRSAVNGWFYVLAQSPQVVLEKVNYIKRITFITALIFLIIGIVLAYFFTYRNSKPLKKIMNTIRDRFQGETDRTYDAYRFIDDAVSRLIDNNQALQDEIEKQAPLLRATFFERLLKGDFVAGNEIMSLLKHQNLSVEVKSAAAAIVNFAPKDAYDEVILKELDRQRVIIKEMLRAHQQQSVYYHDAAEDMIVLLFLESELTPDSCKHKMEDLFARMRDVSRSPFDLNLNIAAGGVYESLLDVSRSYGEAKHALNFILRQQRTGIVWFYDLPQISDSHYYPGEIETRLMNHAKAGDMDEVNALLDDVYERNFVQRNLSPSIQRLLIYDMAGSLMKLREQLSIEESDNVKSLLNQADSSEELSEAFRYAGEIYAGICRRTNERKKSQNVRLLENIIHCLQTLYMNPDLNLDAAADRMGISKVYMSHFFKEQAGVNFSDYLENLRMDKARVLLADTTLTVNQIAQQTGYNSANSFCRAFKRINGISATAYRGSAGGINTG
ncbi:helix-turn-helix domain-containing protein [Cohnella luojiensis]|nr:helix-turn-helix domain-containing protein [Cohnella luojiensis]